MGTPMNVLNQRTVAVVGAAAAVALGASACGASYGASKATGPTASTSVIRTQSATVGGKQTTILTDGSGRPLYYYAADTAAKSLVTTGLAGIWPALTSSTAPTAPGLSGAVSIVQDTHGSQVEYNGHLLYTFVNDRSGNVTGQGLHNFFVATPGLPTLAAASSTGANSGAMYTNY
jgi:predicted lipoprotein with Yx(FWY)xxD motif